MYHVPSVIRSFRCKNTEALFGGVCAKEFRAFRKTAELKLQVLDAATDLRDLRSPPANRLERLTGDRKGQLSIRINDQWRVCFKWDPPYADDVEITDYH